MSLPVEGEQPGGEHRLLLQNLKKHGKSQGHKDRCNQRDEKIGPHREILQEVLRQFSKGVSPKNGYWCLTSMGRFFVGPHKAYRVVWFLSQGVKSWQQKLILKAASMCLMRDERAGRLHVRFRIASMNLESSCGFLGQARDSDPSALGKTEATVQIMRDFCTKYVQPPMGLDVEPEFNEPLFNQMKHIFEGLASDSASNELVGASDLQMMSKATGAPDPEIQSTPGDAQAAHSRYSA